MKHDCYGGVKREMLLEYRCTRCGDTECAEEFEKEELEIIEKLLNKEIEERKELASDLIQFNIEPFMLILEKVRNM